MVQQVPIGGDYRKIAVFYADAWVGTPPQLATAIADTGSAVMAVPCSQCGSNCGHHLDPPLDMSKSTTAKPCTGGGCTGSQNYAEGDGIDYQLYTDWVFLGAEGKAGEGDNAPFTADRVGQQYTFGCTTS